MSLKGLVIAITGSRRASELASLILSRGGDPYLAPTVGIEVADEKCVEGFLNSILGENPDYAVFMTGPSVYLLTEIAANLGLKSKLVETLNASFVVARSGKPRAALERHGVRVDLVPDENTWEGILHEMRRREIKGKKIAVLWHGAPAPALREELEKLGGRVTECTAYNYSVNLEEKGARVLASMGYSYISPDVEKILELFELLLEGKIDAITFTSPPSARNFFQLAAEHGKLDQLKRQLNEQVIVVAIGPPTQKAIEENGVAVDVVPSIYKMGAMVKALEEYVSKLGPAGRKMSAGKNA